MFCTRCGTRISSVKETCPTCGPTRDQSSVPPSSSIAKRRGRKSRLVGALAAAAILCLLAIYGLVREIGPTVLRTAYDFGYNPNQSSKWPPLADPGYPIVFKAQNVVVQSHGNNRYTVKLRMVLKADQISTSSAGARFRQGRTLYPPSSLWVDYPAVERVGSPNETGSIYIHTTPYGRLYDYVWVWTFSGLPVTANELVIHSRKSSNYTSETAYKVNLRPYAVAPNAPATREPFAPSGHLDERKFGDYTIRIWNNGGSYQDEGLMEILKGGARAYTATAPAGSFELDDGSFEPNENTVPIGTDVTGNGVPDLVVRVSPRNANCCTRFIIFELGSNFQKLTMVEQGSVMLRIFKSLKGDTL